MTLIYCEPKQGALYSTLMKRGTSFSRRLIIMDEAWNQIHSGKIFAELKLVRTDGLGRGIARWPPGSCCRTLACYSPFDFTDFHPLFEPPVDLSIGRPPSRLPLVHAAGQTGVRADACRLACLPSQPPLWLVGSSCRLFAFLHGFQVKSSGVFSLWLPRRLGTSPKAPSVPLWPLD